MCRTLFGPPSGRLGQGRMDEEVGEKRPGSFLSSSRATTPHRPSSKGCLPIYPSVYPVETRFATNFIMIDRLLQVRNALERMIIDDEWSTLMSDLRRRSPMAYAKAASVRQFIRSDGFLGHVRKFPVHGYSGR